MVGPVVVERDAGFNVEQDLAAIVLIVFGIVPLAEITGAPQYVPAVRERLCQGQIPALPGKILLEFLDTEIVQNFPDCNP